MDQAPTACRGEVTRGSLVNRKASDKTYSTPAGELLRRPVWHFSTAGLGIWGAINLLEGYGNDNPGAKSQGMKQLMAGGGVALIGITLVPLLSGLFG